MDVVVTVPKTFGLQAWINEGPDLPGAPWSGLEWHFYLGRGAPTMKPGDLVYIVYNNKIRGYAPLIRIERTEWGCALVRRGGAVAVTIPEKVIGFRGFRYRWWDKSIEVPFPDWMKP